MAQKTETHINATVTHGMRALLLDDQIPATIATSFEDIEKIILQVQRDVSTQRDDDVTLQIIKGADKILDILRMFQAEGREVLAEYAKH